MTFDYNGPLANILVTLSNCILPSKQFHKLSKRQWIILLALRERGCMTTLELANLCMRYWHNTRFPDSPFKELAGSHERIETIPKAMFVSIARSLRELEARNLVARALGRKPSVFCFVSWLTDKPVLSPSYADWHLCCASRVQHGLLVFKSKDYFWEVENFRITNAMSLEEMRDYHERRMQEANLMIAKINLRTAALREEAIRRGLKLP